MSDVAGIARSRGAADDAYQSPPIQRAARLLRRIAEGDAVTNMAQTARALNINRTTLLRIVHTLESERFIEPRTDGRGWQIGVGLIGLTAQSFFSDDLVQTAVPVLSRVAAQLNLSAHLGILDGRDVVYVLRRVPNGTLARNIRVGSRLPAHAASMGRIILAHMPAERVDRLFTGIELAAVTAHTPVTLLQLHERIVKDRAEGLAWSDGFYEAGISSVAAAIFDAGSSPVAAINVSGHSDRFAGPERRSRIGETITQAANEISQRLGWSPHSAGRVPAIPGISEPAA